MNKSRLVIAGSSLCVMALSGAALAYPIDEYPRTGIRRLQPQFEIENGDRKGRHIDPGGTWSGKQIELKMEGAGRSYDLTTDTPKHAALQAGLEEILRKWSWRRYNVAILDITDPGNPRFAGVNEHTKQTPGSVAKVLVGAGMLNMLKERYPNDIAKREELLRTHSVSMDDWGLSDSHTVPFVAGEKLEKVFNRRIRIGDTFTLWEWMDHALSASNNTAASTTWREATLMKLMGNDYPPATYDRDLWKKWDRETISKASFDVVDQPLIDAGIDPEKFTLRLYFTTGANKYIKSASSRTTPFAIVKWMLRVEQGRMVDRFSSIELKKMLYLTRRRVRYLYTNKLNDYAAWFKSGSLYRFSENAERIQYQGDIVNVLNSLIEIDTTPPPLTKEEKAAAAETTRESTTEKPSDEKTAKNDAPRDPFAKGITDAAGRPYVYIVAVMSNELKRNAALDHSRLGEAIHELIVTTP